jgi:SAM-dependent methyltransferase
MLSSSAREYKEALGILANSSQHIPLIAQAIKQHVLPKITKKHSMIDVGAGIGILTHHFKSDFDEITVLDINPAVEVDLKVHPYKVEICDFFKYETDKKYDFVLCSHVMYHFDEQQMKDFIIKLQSLVSPGGYCFIALIAPRGKNHLFHEKFKPDYVNSQQITKILEKEGVLFDRIEAASPHHLITDDPAMMRSLLKFFLIENCLRQASSSLPDEQIKLINILLDEEVAKAKLPDSNVHDFEQEDDYFLIRGPGYR